MSTLYLLLSITFLTSLTKHRFVWDVIQCLGPESTWDVRQKGQDTFKKKVKKKGHAWLIQGQDIE